MIKRLNNKYIDTHYSEPKEFIFDVSNDKLMDKINELVDEINEINKIILNQKQSIEPNNCNHRDSNGAPTIKYDSSYEMRSSEMHCTQCGKEGTREELWNESNRN